MIVTVVTWRIKTNPSQPSGYDILQIRRETQPAPENDAHLLETAGDFIARHVLEKDSVLFEG